jgi:hypothetical protein
MRRRRGAILLALIVAFAVVPLPHANAAARVTSSGETSRRC